MQSQDSRGRLVAGAADMIRRRANAVYLTDVTFPPALTPIESLPDAVGDADVVVVAVPSHGLRAIVQAAANHIAAGTIVVSATKGLETHSLDRMSQVIAEAAPGHPVAVLSGPSFAAEVARGLPTAVVVASTDGAIFSHRRRSDRVTPPPVLSPRSETVAVNRASGLAPRFCACARSSTIRNAPSDADAKPPCGARSHTGR